MPLAGDDALNQQALQGRRVWAGQFAFVLGSATDEVDGCVLVAAAGSPGVLRTAHFAAGQTDEGLDRAQPIVVEGELVVIRHPARGEFRAVVELQVREARRVQ
ncbi:MAG TPA: hypothetical protein VKD72_00410 [Gemmataceae bacterium]|nr:hypothetical protein [Gemmataceae bacterium]